MSAGKAQLNILSIYIITITIIKLDPLRAPRLRRGRAEGDRPGRCLHPSGLQHPSQQDEEDLPSGGRRHQGREPEAKHRRKGKLQGCCRPDLLWS